MSTHIDPNCSSDPIISNDPTASNDQIDFKNQKSDITQSADKE